MLRWVLNWIWEMREKQSCFVYQEEYKTWGEKKDSVIAYAKMNMYKNGEDDKRKTKRTIIVYAKISAKLNEMKKEREAE